MNSLKIFGMAFLLAAGNAIAAPIRVLLLSGQTVHDTAATTPFLEQMYNDSGKFKVVAVIEDMARITAETFAQCDVIVSNWTCHPVMTGGPWTPEGKQAFAEAIGRGKGMVSFHAASAACNDWAEFQEISGLTWILNHTSHTAYHTFKVVVNDDKHAITRGLPDFWITDELYQRMVKRGKSEFKTLASAFADANFGGTRAWEPMLITTQLGKGRGVNLLLGHDVAAMRNPAWQTLMLRSTEWAATGKTSIKMPEDWPTTPAAAAIVGVNADAAVQAAAGYAHGQDRGPLFAVEQLVNHAASRTDKTAAADRAALAGKLAAAIASCKTSEAKAFFCRQLGMIGTPEQVAAIAPLLADDRAATMARFALERIPGPAAAAALHDALPQLQGALRIGTINSIGNRADTDSVTAVAAFLKDADAPTAIAAASALGRIGTVPAADALKSARQTAPQGLRPAITDAYLTCGEGLLAAGDKQEAAGVYKLLYAPAEPPAVRAAALRGLVNSQPTQATSLIREAFESSTPELHIAVADLIRTPKLGDTKTIAAAAMRAPVDVQPILIAALADRGDKAAATSLRRGLDHESEAVRVATLAALGRLGDEADAGFLADRAVKGTEAERSVAFDVLRRMPAQAAEDAIIGLLLSDPGPIQSAAASALVKRPADKKVFELLETARDESVQVELTRALGQIGDPALPVLERQAASESTLIRQAALDAMLSWPTPEAMSLLLEIARKPAHGAARPAIVRSVVRMLPAAELSKPKKVRVIDELLHLAGTPEDKKLALELLAGYPLPEALTIAMSYVKQPDAADAAAVVALRIASTLAGTHKEQVRSAMRELIQASSGDTARQAKAILLKASRPVNLARGAVADSPDNLGPDGAAGGDAAGIDGDPATYWDEIDSQPLYRYRVTFKEPVRVSAILIVGHAFGSHCPKDFEILCDDKVVKTVRDASYDRDGVEAFFRFEPVTCTSLELKITGYDGKSPAIRELEIYDWPADSPATSQPGASPSQPAYGWKQTETSLALMNGERIVWRFNFGNDQPKTCFDPLNLPDGTETVWLSPPDHPWHFALWFSWKELNGLNYWEQWNVSGQGRTEVVDARATAHADYSAEFVLTVGYRPDGKPPILTEKRAIHVSAPDATGAYRIDWTSAFTAGTEDVHMKGGTAGGGYAGLSVRISPRTREWQLLDSEGRRDVTSEGMARTTHGQRSRWADFSFVSTLTEESAGIAMFDHPVNLRHPSQWHNLINEGVPFGYFSPAPLWSEPYTLPAGKELLLRYRVFVHPGRPEPARLDQEFQSFAAK